jgi:hypothetical protein
MLSSTRRITRRRSSAGPQPPAPPRRAAESTAGRGLSRPTYLTLRDHGKVFVADLPRLSDGQLSRVAKEAREVLESLNRRLEELEHQESLRPAEQETLIRASTKRGVTERFLQAIDEEQSERRNNPALTAAAGESLARAFMEIARHRLAGATFDSLLQEALTACDEHDSGAGTAISPATGASAGAGADRMPATSEEGNGSPDDALVVSVPHAMSLPVVLSPDPSAGLIGH